MTTRIRDGVDTPLASLFVHPARTFREDADGVEQARSVTEAFLFRRLETLPETKSRFCLNVALPILFDGQSRLEVRHKDQLLQESDYSFFAPGRGRRQGTPNPHATTRPPTTA